MVREVTPDRLKVMKEKEKRSQDQARERLEKAFEIQKMLDGQTLEFALKGVGTKIFGGLDEHAIASKVNEKFGIHFEKNDIKLPNKTHIKKSGNHLVYLHITRDTMAKIVVEVSVDI
jgi:ribosomal protein L9